MKPAGESTFVLLLVVSLLHIDSISTAVTPVCNNMYVALHCSVPDPSAQSIWRYKSENSPWLPVAQFSENKAHLSPTIPLKFKNVTIFENGSLTISSFSTELSGIYACSSENRDEYYTVDTVVAVNCERQICEGDDAIIECQLLRYRNLLLTNGQLKELVWKQGVTTVVLIGMDSTYHNPKYKNIHLSKEIRGALVVESAGMDLDGQQYTCTLHGEAGVTPRRYSTTINVIKCEKEKTACERKSIDLKCPYYQLLLTSTSEDTMLEWHHGSRKIVTLFKNRSHAIHSNSSIIKISESKRNGLVTLVSPSVHDSGVYVCKVFRKKVVISEHSVTVNATQCQISSLRERKLNNEASKDEPEVPIDVLEIVLLTGFVIIILIALPICTYCMSIRQRQPDDPPNNA